MFIMRTYNKNNKCLGAIAFFIKGYSTFFLRNNVLFLRFIHFSALFILVYQKKVVILQQKLKNKKIVMKKIKKPVSIFFLLSYDLFGIYLICQGLNFIGLCSILIGFILFDINNNL